MNIDEIKILAAKIADLWRSEEVENHALGLMFLRGQTLGWGGMQFNKLLQYIAYYSINTDEFNGLLFFKAADEPIKNNFRERTKYCWYEKDFDVSKWARLTDIASKNCILLNLGGFLRFQVCVELTSNKFDTYIRSLSNKFPFRLHLSEMHIFEEEFFNNFHKPENYKLIIRQDLGWSYSQILAFIESDFCDHPRRSFPSEEILDAVMYCFVDNYLNGRFIHLFDSL